MGQLIILYGSSPEHGNTKIYRLFGSSELLHRDKLVGKYFTVVDAIRKQNELEGKYPLSEFYVVTPKRDAPSVRD